MSFGTGAGKGDLPRAVDGASYRNNYDNIFKKTTEPSVTDTLEELQAKFDAAIANRNTAEVAYYWALLAKTK
jgi:hypothetical protein